MVMSLGVRQGEGSDNSQVSVFSMEGQASTLSTKTLLHPLSSPQHSCLPPTQKGGDFDERVSHVAICLNPFSCDT